jgi:hypothetical protein
MHRRAAAGAIGIVGLDRHIDARQMERKRTAIDAALRGPHACSRRVLLVVFGFLGGDGLLDIFERQKQLIGIELLRAPAELRALQGLADEVGQPGESSAVRFAKAYASGDRNRIPNGDALLREFNKLGRGDLSFRFTPQTGHLRPEESVRRVTVQSDDEPRTNSDYQPYPYTSEPKVVSPPYDPLQSWNDAIDEIVRAQGLSRSEAINEAMKVPSARVHLTNAKSMKFLTIAYQGRAADSGRIANLLAGHSAILRTRAPQPERLGSSG